VRPATFAAIVAFASAASIAALPQQKPDTPQPTKGDSAIGSPTASETSISGAKGSAAVSSFLMKAAEGGKAEVELGNLASTKASNADVKSFGQMMVTDHTSANNEVMSLAQTKKVTVSGDLNARDKSTRDRLDKLSGEAFDKAYMADMVRDHQADIKEFEAASKSSDADVRSFATRTLPTLRHHLEEAQRISKEVSAGSSKTSGMSAPASQKPAASPKTAGKSGETAKDK
jgi:putative membrane protein